MYGLPETSKKVYRAFNRVGQGKASDEDMSVLDNHIEEKKKDIREAKVSLDVEGFKTMSPPKPKTPIQQIMWHLNGGRR